MTTTDQVSLHLEAIGRVTSQWEVCELYLAEIYQILCESENDAPFRCYGALISSSIRFELLDIGLATYFKRPSGLRDEFTRHLKKARELSSQRNKVAHANLHPTISRRSIKFLQIPLWHQTRRYKDDRPSYIFNVDEVLAIARTIAGFALMLRGLVLELEAFDRKRRGQRARLRQAKAHTGQTRAQ